MGAATMIPFPAMLVREVNSHLHACMAAFQGIFLDMDWLRRSRKNETGFEESSFACLSEFCLLLPLSTFCVLYLYAVPCHFTCSDSAWAVLNSRESELACFFRVPGAVGQGVERLKSLLDNTSRMSKELLRHCYGGSILREVGTGICTWLGVSYDTVFESESESAMTLVIVLGHLTWVNIFNFSSPPTQVLF